MVHGYDEEAFDFVVLSDVTEVCIEVQSVIFNQVLSNVFVFTSKNNAENHCLYSANT